MHSHCLVCLWQKFWNSKRWVRSLFCSIAFMESSSVEISRSMLYISRTWNLGLETQNLFLILHLKRNMKDERSKKINTKCTKYLLWQNLFSCWVHVGSWNRCLLIQGKVSAHPGNNYHVENDNHGKAGNTIDDDRYFTSRLKTYWDKGNMAKKWITTLSFYGKYLPRSDHTRQKTMEANIEVWKKG